MSLTTRRKLIKTLAAGTLLVVASRAGSQPAPYAPPPAVMAQEPAKAIPYQNQISGADYPPEARSAGEEGLVRVSYVVGKTGSVEKCEVIVSSGSQRLDDATCPIIMARFRFTPARLYGVLVSERKVQSIRWQFYTPAPEPGTPTTGPSMQPQLEKQ